jgi:hypothetical protein
MKMDKLYVVSLNEGIPALFSNEKLMREFIADYGRDHMLETGTFPVKDCHYLVGSTKVDLTYDEWNEKVEDSEGWDYDDD